MTPIRRSPALRGLAFGLALWLGGVPPLALAAKGKSDEAQTPAPVGPGTIRGILYTEDEVTRLAGATVTAINVKTGRRYISNHTGKNGAYEVTELPPGTYDVTIDSNNRIYVTDALVDLAENQRLYLSFAVRAPTGAAAESPILKGGAKMTFTDPKAVPQASSGEKKGFWKSPGGIAIISVLVAGATATVVSAQQSD
jgi:carboxypeptidase family protein